MLCGIFKIVWSLVLQIVFPLRNFRRLVHYSILLSAPEKFEKCVDVGHHLRIPEYPATRSDDIRPLIPGYPASLGSASLSLFP